MVQACERAGTSKQAREQAANNQQPTTNNRQPTTNNQQPSQKENTAVAGPLDNNSHIATEDGDKQAMMTKKKTSTQTNIQQTKRTSG